MRRVASTRQMVEATVDGGVELSRNRAEKQHTTCTAHAAMKQRRMNNSPNHEQVRITGQAFDFLG